MIEELINNEDEDDSDVDINKFKYMRKQIKKEIIESFLSEIIICCV